MDENYYGAEAPLDLSFLVPFAIFAILLAFVLIISQWRIYKKAGKPGWGVLVPIYNLYLNLKIVGKPGWWMLLFFVPLVNIFFAIKSVHLLSKSFGKDLGFTLGLLFLPFVFYPILAFGKAAYEGPYGDPQAFAAYQNQNQFEFEEVR